MKSMMILGALSGFVLGAICSLTGNCSGPTIFWHSMVAALVGGLLARWCGRIWLNGLAEALEQQRRARAQAAEKKNTAKV
jgi:membrane protein DedA with SNARE-associated domain